MKKAEDSNALVFHMYEWAGKNAQADLALPPGATGVTETNLLEQPVGDPLAVKGNHVSFPIRPYEIVAIRADYPKSSQ
jgi:alpha-mannosidase